MPRHAQPEGLSTIAINRVKKYVLDNDDLAKPSADAVLALRK